MENDSGIWETKRQKLIKILKTEVSGWLDLKPLINELEYNNKKTLIHDIESISKTLRSEGIQLLIKSASCIACGFVFGLKRGALKIPSKCPKCKQQRINWPSISLKNINKK